MQQPPWNHEQAPDAWPDEEPGDETMVNPRACPYRVDEARMRADDPVWTDGQLMDWRGDFREDGYLFPPNSGRDVDAAGVWRELEAAIACRACVRGA